MATSRSSLQQFVVTAIFVLGVAWVSINVFISVLLPGYFLFFPFLLAAVPLFIGTWALGRRPGRYGIALVVVGALLMISGDVYVAAIYPRYSDSFPMAQMLQFTSKLVIMLFTDPATRATPAPSMHH